MKTGEVLTREDLRGAVHGDFHETLLEIIWPEHEGFKQGDVIHGRELGDAVYALANGIAVLSKKKARSVASLIGSDEIEARIKAAIEEVEKNADVKADSIREAVAKVLGLDETPADIVEAVDEALKEGDEALKKVEALQKERDELSDKVKSLEAEVKALAKDLDAAKKAAK